MAKLSAYILTQYIQLLASQLLLFFFVFFSSSSSSTTSYLSLSSMKRNSVTNDLAKSKIMPPRRPEGSSRPHQTDAVQCQRWKSPDSSWWAQVGRQGKYEERRRGAGGGLFIYVSRRAMPSPLEGANFNCFRLMSLFCSFLCSWSGSACSRAWCANKTKQVAVSNVDCLIGKSELFVAV